MLVSCTRTERPRGPSLQFDVDLCHMLCRIGGRLGSFSASWGGVTVEIPPCMCRNLTHVRDPYGGQRQMGSLTGAVAS